MKLNKQVKLSTLSTVWWGHLDRLKLVGNQQWCIHLKVAPGLLSIFLLKHKPRSLKVDKFCATNWANFSEISEHLYQNIRLCLKSGNIAKKAPRVYPKLRDTWIKALKFLANPLTSICREILQSKILKYVYANAWASVVSLDRIFDLVITAKTLIFPKLGL